MTCHYVNLSFPPPSMSNPISILPFPIPYLSFHSQSHIYPSIPNPISILPFPIPYLSFHSQSHIYPSIPIPISILPFPIPYLSFHSQSHIYPAVGALPPSPHTPLTSTQCPSTFPSHTPN